MVTTNWRDTAEWPRCFESRAAWRVWDREVRAARKTSLAGWPCGVCSPGTQAAMHLAGRCANPGLTVPARLHRARKVAPMPEVTPDALHDPAPERIAERGFADVIARLDAVATQLARLDRHGRPAPVTRWGIVVLPAAGVVIGTIFAGTIKALVSVAASIIVGDVVPW